MHSADDVRFIDPIAIRRQIEALFARMDGMNPRQAAAELGRWQDATEVELSKLPFDDAVAVRDMITDQVKHCAERKRFAGLHDPVATAEPDEKVPWATIVWLALAAIVILSLVTARHG